MSKKNEKYVLKSQVHFGSLKTSVPKGTVVEIDRDRKVVVFNGVEHENVNEVDMMIRAGYIIPYVEGMDASSAGQKAKEPVQEAKLDVRKSDIYSLSQEIDISGTKKEVREQQRKAAKLEVIKEEKSEETSRGIPVVRNDARGNAVPAETEKEILQVVNGDDYETVAKIPDAPAAKKGFGLASTDDAKEVAAAVNGQEGTVVKKIGKSDATKVVASDRKLSARHASEASIEKAKAAAAERKAASAARRSKAEKK